MKWLYERANCVIKWIFQLDKKIEFIYTEKLNTITYPFISACRVNLHKAVSDVYTY